MNIKNPFNPDTPVPPGVFAGRYKQLNSIYSCIYSTSTSNRRNILITGERGIGKTSIAMVAKQIACKNLPWKNQYIETPLLSVYISVQKATPSEVVVARIIRELNVSINPKITKTKDMLENINKNFSELKLFGSGYTARDKSENPQKIYLESQDCIRKLALSIKENRLYSGICIIIDELDNMGDFDVFSSFWKILQETLAFDDCNNLMLIFVGMPEVIEKLFQSHESFPRTFHPIELEKMPSNEATMIIEKSLPNGTPKKSISEEAEKEILFYSENYPHLIQELGFSSFLMSEDNEIKKEDVEKGLYGSEDYEGSINKLGQLFFRKMYNDIRKNESYKEVLRLMSDIGNGEKEWTLRQEIMEKASKKRTSISAALSNLSNKKFLVKNPDKKGEYKFYSKMFQVYISKIFTK